VSEPTAEFRRLPLRKVIWGAFSLSWEYRAHLIGPIGVPLLAVIACSLAWRRIAFEPPVAAWIALLVAYCFAMSWLAITVHRLVLLEAGNAGTRLNGQDLRRLGVFTAAGVGLWLLCVTLGMLIMGVVVALMKTIYVAADVTTPLPAAMQWIVVLVLGLTAWVLGRLCLVFPAIAVDRKADFVGLWRISRGNAWRLAIVAGVLPMCLALLTNYLEGEDASIAESVVFAAISGPLMIVEVVALSLSYWELTSPGPPPTPPLS
jgi:hypothetical protein